MSQSRYSGQKDAPTHREGMILKTKNTEDPLLPSSGPQSRINLEGLCDHSGVRTHTAPLLSSQGSRGHLLRQSSPGRLTEEGKEGQGTLKSMNGVTFSTVH